MNTLIKLNLTQIVCKNFMNNVSRALIIKHRQGGFSTLFYEYAIEKVTNYSNMSILITVPNQDMQRRVMEYFKNNIKYSVITHDTILIPITNGSIYVYTSTNLCHKIRSHVFDYMLFDEGISYIDNLNDVLATYPNAKCALSGNYNTHVSKKQNKRILKMLTKKYHFVEQKFPYYLADDYDADKMSRFRNMLGDNIFNREMMCSL